MVRSPWPFARPPIKVVSNAKPCFKRVDEQLNRFSNESFRKWSARKRLSGSALHCRDWVSSPTSRILFCKFSNKNFRVTRLHGEKKTHWKDRNEMLQRHVQFCVFTEWQWNIFPALFYTGQDNRKGCSVKLYSLFVSQSGVSCSWTYIRFHLF